ncbi:hypothetical protein GOFOIKOB_4871 [Methylobacterium tardum]|uniref:Helix-turn-helix domain-containing protein n=1 Tax=Methylobacterium tardum TaxID=374432 RepID=A0AA37TF88_9HYPH|nr:hypothetical protein GOFOIKOB_4871 [Methylobacterium tardum]GLS72335.1 hypothetical protein GCM10007890_43480 [Methylobacterium tardum]
MRKADRRDLAAHTALPPRLLSKIQAAQYLGLTPRGFDRWRKDGRIPNPLPGTARWDRNAIDSAIDALSQLGSLRASTPIPQPEADPLEEWRKKRDERRNRRG